MSETGTTEKPFRTKITEMLSIRYPIIGGTMMWLSRAELVGAVSKAGGLGILASAIFDSKEKFRDEIKKIRDITPNPFAVNLNFFPAMRPIPNDEYIEVLIEENVKIVETSGHIAPPVEVIRKLKDEDVKIIHKCATCKHAKKAESLGVDAVTVVGYENGGAVGMQDVGSLVLVAKTVGELKIPVIGGGGVADGRGFLAILALGAEGVIVGTRFLLSSECAIHDNLRRELVNATENDTTIIMKSIRATHRVYKNKVAEKVLQLENEGAGIEELIRLVGGDKSRKMFETGDIDAGVVACGQAIGLIGRVIPVGQVIEEIIEQAIEIRERLVKMADGDK